jgi:lysozyme family protein
MSTIELALPVIFKHEGLFVNNPNDPGGATKYGISLRFLKSLKDIDHDGFLEGDLDHDGDVDLSDIKDMTMDQAANLYRVYFWDKYGYSRITDQILATKIFDLAVNMGSIQAHKLAQRACWALNGYKCINDDGLLGNISIALLNALKPIAPIRSEADGFYRSLVVGKPAWQPNLNGWLARAYS